MEDFINSSCHLLIAKSRLDFKDFFPAEWKHLEETDRLTIRRTTLSRLKPATTEENTCLVAERAVAERLMFKFQKTEGKVFFHISKNGWIKKDALDIMKVGDILKDKHALRIIRLEETGLMQKIWRRHLPKPLRQDEGDVLVPLTVDSFGLGFIVWGTGIFASIVIFILEKKR